MANPVVEALTPADHTFAAVGDSYDFNVRATDTDTVAGEDIQTFQFTVIDSADNEIPITFTAHVPTLTPETLTWQPPSGVPAGWSVAFVNVVNGNPATATYRITRTV
jgi:hypothetical protein